MKTLEALNRLKQTNIIFPKQAVPVFQRSACGQDPCRWRLERTYDLRVGRRGAACV